MPDDIHSIQRREYYRVGPKILEPVKVIHEDGKETLAVNLSVGGLAFWHHSPMEPQEELSVTVILPNETKVDEVRLKIIWTDMDPITSRSREDSRGRYKVRGRFMNVAESELQMINRYIIERQREMLKFQK